MSLTLPKSLPRVDAAGALPAPVASTRAVPEAWRVWACLWIVYIVWGSTYLAIRVMVETVPPLLGAGTRFMLAGGGVLAVLLARRGWAAIRPTRRQLLGALIVGTLLTGANAVVTLAEVDVPSGLAALLIASIPLIVILLRRASGERVQRFSVVGVAIGFLGVAVLLAPGARPDGATLIGMLACVGAAAMWATGSFSASRTDLPGDPFVSTGWQLLLGGTLCALAGVARGELGGLDPSALSSDSILAFAYLVVIGSIVAFSAYTWLLRNAPVSKVATYAYVNPVIAIFLGWLVLGETITAVTLIGATVIVASVAIVVRVESRRRTV
jgi:drug/metabolite transporter (DMT)-like permease